MQQRAQPGYYPGYSTLGQKKFWDAKTRSVVEHRVQHTPPIRFFTAEELPTINAMCECMVPQDDRLPDRRIAVVNVIDSRLYKNELNGYQYDNMPPDREAYRLAIQAVNQTAMELHGRPFAQVDRLNQDLIMKSIHDGKPLGAHELWEKMAVHRFWEMFLSDCATAYYSHPWSWDEIGYGGPAYPRAYMRLENGEPEPWEKREKRYEWEAPPDTVSDAYEEHPGSSEQSHSGQGGTH